MRRTAMQQPRFDADGHDAGARLRAHDETRQEATQ